MNVILLNLNLLLHYWVLSVLLLDVLSLPRPARQTLEGSVSPVPPAASLYNRSGWHRRWYLRLGTLSTALLPLAWSLLSPGMCFCSLGATEKPAAPWKWYRVHLASHLVWWPVPDTAGGGQAKCNGARDATHQTCVSHWWNQCPTWPIMLSGGAWSGATSTNSAEHQILQRQPGADWLGKELATGVVRSDRQHTDRKELNFYLSLLFASLQILFWGRGKKNHVLC